MRVADLKARTYYLKTAQKKVGMFASFNARSAYLPMSALPPTNGQWGHSPCGRAAGIGPEWSFQRRAVGPHVVKIYTKGDLRELKSAIDPF